MAEEEAEAPVPVDPRVRLTLGRLGAAIDHINRKAVAPNDACIVCGSPDNNVILDVYRVDVLTNPTMVGGAHQPLISTVCNNCGFVRFFNRLIVDKLVQEYEATKSATTYTAEPEAESGG